MTHDPHKGASDCVELLPSTAEALNSLEIIGHVGRVNVDEQAMAWLTFVLKELPDEARYFPHGKWATIQHIEGTLQRMAAQRAKEIV